ncbi:MAG: ABC transporter ATP-binding protein [Armatimonadetes bacterium]|nr:ABC transporter ATP-binding protein [Armatimonadota bacterium]
MKRSGIRGLLAALGSYRRHVALGMLGVVVSDGAQLAVPMLIRPMVDDLTAGTADVVSLSRYALVIVALAAFAFGAKYVWRHFMFSAGRLVEMDIRRDLLDQALNLPAAENATIRTGEFMALATNDVSSVRMAISFGLIAAFDAIGFSLAAFGLMVWLDWRLALWTCIPFPLLGLIMWMSLGHIYDRWDRVQANFEKLTERVREGIAGMRVLRAHVQGQGDLLDFDKTNDEYYRLYMDYVRINSLFQPAIVLLAGSSTAILLGVGGLQVISGQASMGTFTAFSAYLAQLTWPMIAAGWVINLVQRGAASMDRIERMLGRTREPAGGQAPPPAQGGIRAEGVTFTYPGAAVPALRDVAFELAPGGSLGVVGEIGSGKSTLSVLLLRLYDPPAGSLLLDGMDILDYDLGELRRRIALVPQEAFLFSDTIRENLLLGDPEASQERLEEACRLAAIHDEILEFPEGYETVLGERGVTLSGGQKQRLCLARALLKRSPVLLFDDTLSAVDPDTERRILDSLRDRLESRTALVISHRVSAVQDLDRILVLHQGGVVATGTHRELLARPGLYRDLYELQKLAEL